MGLISIIDQTLNKVRPLSREVEVIFLRIFLSLGLIVFTVNVNLTRKFTKSVFNKVSFISFFFLISKVLRQVDQNNPRDPILVTNQIDRTIKIKWLNVISDVNYKRTEGFDAGDL